MVNRLKLNEKTVREAETWGRDYQIFDTTRVFDHHSHRSFTRLPGRWR
jgi:hypothetical protein